MSTQRISVVWLLVEVFGMSAVVLAGIGFGAITIAAMWIFSPLLDLAPVPIFVCYGAFVSKSMAALLDADWGPKR